jgi:hypothetical protein
VSFPAGVFRLLDLARDNDPYPSDVTVRGVGMNATLVVCEPQRARGALQRLRVEDCTIHVDSGLTDVRSAPSVVALSSTRVVGFDCGAGNCAVLYVRAAAVQAIDCRFEGGYGHHPGGYANVLPGGTPCLARFDRCVFDRVELSLPRSRSVLFVDCELNEMLESKPNGPTFRNCRYSEIAAENKWNGDYRRRDLNDLFPQWRERLR